MELNMNASLKPTPGRQVRGMRQLESKIADLQTLYQRLLKERQQEIAILLSAIDLAHLDDKTLAGGLLFIKEKVRAQDSIVEAWRDAGEKFLRRSKPKSHQGGEQAGEGPQIPSEKHAPSKQNAVSQTTPQSSQKAPQPREK